MQELPSVKLRISEFKDYKKRLIDFITSLEHEPATMETLHKIKHEKESFKQMLKRSRLDYLFEDVEKTKFEWQCYFDLLNILCALDQGIEQCQADFYNYTNREKELKDKMHIWYSEEY